MELIRRADRQEHFTASFVQEWCGSSKEQTANTVRFLGLCVLECVVPKRAAYQCPAPTEITDLGKDRCKEKGGILSRLRTVGFAAPSAATCVSSQYWK